MVLSTSYSVSGSRSSNGRERGGTSVLTRQHANTPQSATQPQRAAAHLTCIKHFSVFFFFPF